MTESFLTKWERVIKAAPRDKRPAQNDPLVLTTHSEIIFGGIRLKPGTYQVRRITDEDLEEPQF